MAHEITLPASQTHLLLEERKVKKRSGLDGIRNILSGRFFENWRETLLSLATVYCVIDAAIAFFSGYWIASILKFTTSAFLAVLRKEIRDLTDLHAATALIREQNMEFALSNLALHEQIGNLKTELGKLSEENTRFEESNEEYAKHIEAHRFLLQTFEKTTERLGQEVRDAILSGNALTGKVLEKFLEGIKHIEQENQNFENLTGEMRSEHRSRLQQLHQMFDQIKHSGDQQIQIINQANNGIRDSLEKLRRIQGEIAKYGPQAEAIKEQVTFIKRETDRLERIRKGIEHDVNRMIIASRELRAESKCYLDAVRAYRLASSKLSESTRKSGEIEISIERFLLIIVLASHVARSYFSDA